MRLFLEHKRKAVGVILGLAFAVLLGSLWLTESATRSRSTAKSDSVTHVGEYAQVIGIITQPCERVTADNRTLYGCDFVLNITGVELQQVLRGDMPQKASATSYMAMNYAEYFSTAGLRSVFIPFNLPKDELRALISQCNGLVMAGGMQSKRSPFFAQMVSLLRDFLPSLPCSIPVFGVCSGFEIIIEALAKNKKKLLQNDFNAWGLEAAIDWRSKMRESLLFGRDEIDRELRKAVRRTFETHPISFNHHTNGVRVDEFLNDPWLRGNLTMTGVSKDRNGTEFVTILESKPGAKRFANLVGVQFHPEKTSFEHSNYFYPELSHSYNAMYANLYFAQAFASVMREANDNRMDDDTFLKWRTRGFPNLYTPAVNHSGFFEAFKEWVFFTV